MHTQPAVLVILNPTAARGGAAARFERIRNLLGARAQIEVSRMPGHAEDLAQAAATHGCPTIVAAGGDGTVHEVINGIMKGGAGRTSLGVIPLGSGNDYAASLGVPANEAQLCAAFCAEATRSVDVGEIADESGRRRFFVNTLGVGLSGAVVWETLRIRRLRGMALYGLAAVRSVARHFTAPTCKLGIDDAELEIPTLFFAVAIGRREGGGFLVAPDAELDDGLFDYLHAARLTRWGALRYLPSLALGKLPLHDSRIRTGRCRSIRLDSPSPLAIHVDGEVFATPFEQRGTINVRLHPLALSVRGAAAPASR